MKSFKNFIITIFLTLIMTFGTLCLASKLFIPKWIDHECNMMSYIVKGFYEEEKNTLDVLFTGNSDVYRGVSPMALYNEYGITSYNFVSSGQRMWIAYAMLEEALKYQNPKIVFFNVDELYYTSKTNGGAHKVYDNMLFGKAKINAILDSNYERPFIEKLSHFLPIFTYHDRYKELTALDFKYAFKNYSNPTKGMDLVAIQKSLIYDENYMKKTDEVRKIPDKNIEYLDKMRELCQSKEIEFILVSIPSPDSWSYKNHNAVEAYAQEYNLKFLDLNLELDEIGINWDLDTSDGGDHLNVYGAEKVALYLGKYLTENYEFKNYKDDINYSNWNDDYQKYLEIKNKEIELSK